MRSVQGKKNQKAAIRSWQKRNPAKLAAASKRWRLSNLEKVAKTKRQQLLRSYGVSLEWFDAKLKLQGSRCAICRSPEPGPGPWPQWCVDHNHTTGAARGLLCWQCNRGLGCFKDNLEFLQAAEAYLAV